MKNKFISVLKLLAIIEVVYLLVFNLALNLPVTQTLINDIKPDKFTVYWDKAWTWHPFRVHAEGVSVNGQSASQQWQVDLPEASASIAILPLITRTVKIYNVTGESVSYFQRPRLKTDKDYAAVQDYFPPIRDRKVNQARLVIKKKRKAWDILLDDIQVSGSHNFWVYQLKGAIEGDLQADLNFQTQGGPFSVDHGKVDLKVRELTINGTQKVLRQAKIEGDVTILPVVLKQNKGLKVLPFLQIDAKIDGDVDSLAFLNLYTGNFHDMKIDGVGKLAGRLKFDQGKLLSGTDLAVSATELSVDLMSHRAEGNGSVNLNVSADKPEDLNLSIQFDKISAYHELDKRPLLKGEGLAISAIGNTSMALDSDKQAGVSTLTLSVPAVNVPDLAAYQRYLPKKWQFKLHGGTGELHAKAELLQTSFNADLNLSSDQADVAVKNYRFKTDLDVGIKFDSPSFASAAIDISGTYIKLGDARLTIAEKGESTKIQTSLVIDKGELRLRLPDLAGKDINLEQLTHALSGKDLEALLSVADAELDINGNMSDLSWISMLLKNSHNLSIGGTGKVKIRALLDSGWLSKGTLIEVLPENLLVNILDYVIQGDGLVKVAVMKGGQSPDVKLDLNITDGVFKRQNEEQAYIEDVVIKLDALGKNLSYDGPGEELELHFQIPSAKVKNMSVFNQYFPEKSPMQILSGTADLIADINLQPKSAGGYVKLHAPNFKSRVDDQEIQAQLKVDIKLADGVPKNLDFDIAGSTLLLDQVKVIGEETSFDQSDWNIKFDLNKGRVVWKKPVRIQAEADILMKDTRPIVAMLSNHRKKHGWLEKLLTIENIKGEAVMDMQQQQIVIPYAFVTSDKIDIGAKGIINANTRDGMFYARYKKLKGLLKIRDGKRNFDILKAKKTFDGYSPVAISSNK